MTEANMDISDIKRPGKDSENWYTIQQQSFTVDKSEYILEAFKKDFPHVKVADFDQLQLVLSRSSKLQEWYALKSLAFTDAIQLPVAYKDLFKPSDYKSYFEDIQEYKGNLAKESSEIELLSNKFTEDLNKIKDRYKKLNDEIIDKNKFYPIITINGQDLPLSLQLEIEQYTPKTGDVTQQRSLYGREMLINYKRALIQKVQEKPEIDVLELIEGMKLK
jgi:hypothetical protein